MSSSRAKSNQSLTKEMKLEEVQTAAPKDSGSQFVLKNRTSINKLSHTDRFLQSCGSRLRSLWTNHHHRQPRSVLWLRLKISAGGAVFPGAVDQVSVRI